MVFLVDPKLIGYVREQRAAGYSDEQIAEALRSAGYPESLLSAALSAAEKPTVADSNLIASYVQTYLSQGFSEDDIRTSLFSQGYSPRDIEHAFKKRRTHTAHKPLSKSTLIVFPIIAVLIITGAFFFLPGGETPAPTTAPERSFSEPVRLSQVDDELSSLARSDVGAARALCEEVVQGDRGRCLLSLSRETGDASVCEDIGDVRLRDRCYMDFVYEMELEYCSEVELASNVEYCADARSFNTGA